MRAPATRDQVDAYRFGLRRLESALVRGDGVPLHEQVRAQRRAALAGVLLGLLAVAGVGAVALVSPQPDWRRHAVVVGRESGAMYVVAKAPERLVPVANLVAARLVLGALQRGGAAGGDPATAVPVVVPDDALADAPRTAASGVPGAEAVRPDAPGIPSQWAVCDEVESGGSGRVRLVGTTVVAGAAAPVGSAAARGPEPGGPGVLLRVPDGSTWLVVGDRRHRVDAGDALVLSTFGLNGAAPRVASAALVSALPEGVALQRPTIPRSGAAGPVGLGERVGDVLMVRLAGGDVRPHIVLADGLQPVPAALARLLWAGRVAALGSTGTAVDEPREVDALQVAGVPVVERLALGDWPAAAPALVEVADAPMVCWAWSGADAAAPAGRTLIGRAVPVPEGARTVTLAQADRAGPLLDAVVLGTGGGPVRAVAPGGSPTAGVLFLVSETGVAYGVAPGETQRTIGVGDAPPAPESLVRLLPVGPAVDAAAADVLVDVMARPVG